MKTPKTLGQVAYEATPDEGGKSNFGEWNQAPEVVRRVHEKMAKAIEREVKKRTKYTQRKDGEGWEEESHRVFKLACCDCGLVHDVVIVAGRKGTKIGIAAKRNPRATGQRRRHASGND